MTHHPPNPTSRGEQGIAIIMTALCLIPLMIFAAFGVDLASWYSRDQLPPEVRRRRRPRRHRLDARPRRGHRRSPATASRRTASSAARLARLRARGAFDVTVERGLHRHRRCASSSTDPNADRYFSQVFRGEQALTRARRGRVQPARSRSAARSTTSAATAPRRTSRPTLSYADRLARRRQQLGPAAGGRPGRRHGAGVRLQRRHRQPRRASGAGRTRTTYQPTGFNGANAAAADTRRGSPPRPAPPPSRRPTTPRRAPDATSRATCSSRTAGTNGRWDNGTTVQRRQPLHGSGTGNRQCTWTNVDHQRRAPAGHDTGNPPALGAREPAVPGRLRDRPTAGGGRPPPALVRHGARHAPSARTSGTATGCAGGSGRRSPPRSRRADATRSTSNRSPGFWAQIEGPGHDRHQRRRLLAALLHDEQLHARSRTQQYERPTDVDRGYWYVVQMPGADVGLGRHQRVRRVEPRPAARRPASPVTATSDAGGDTSTTEFRVYEQNNPLDFTDRTAARLDRSTRPTAAPTGACRWRARHGARRPPFKATWRTLCTITASTPGDLLPRQRPDDRATTGNGVNGYALEAVADSHVGTRSRPLYAYADMGMYNNNRCTPAGVHAAAGHVLPGRGRARSTPARPWSSTSGTRATCSRRRHAMYPKMPSPTRAAAGARTSPADDCEYTSIAGTRTPSRPARGDATGATVYAHRQRVGRRRPRAVSSPPPAVPAGSTATWLTHPHRRSRPTTLQRQHRCTPVNPEVDANSCWWGIEYAFSAARRQRRHHLAGPDRGQPGPPHQLRH